MVSDQRANCTPSAHCDSVDLDEYIRVGEAGHLHQRVRWHGRRRVESVADGGPGTDERVDVRREDAKLYEVAPLHTCQQQQIVDLVEGIVELLLEAPRRPADLAGED